MMEDKPLDHASPFRIPKREGGSSPPKEMFTRISTIETKPVPMKIDNNVTPEQNGGVAAKKPNTRTPDSNRKRPLDYTRPRRGPRNFDTPCTSSARHQIAPLDSIMDEMTGQVKRARQEAAERALRSETNEAVADAAVRELTKAALEQHAKDDKMAYDFSNRDELMERLLGYKMLHGRLEAFPAMGYVRVEDPLREKMLGNVRSPESAYTPTGDHSFYRRGGPRTPPPPFEYESKPSPMQATPTRPRGPRTPPGSPGPHTPPPPPCAPPPEEAKPDPMLTHMAALSGQDAGQLEAYLGADMMKTLGAVSKDVLLQKLKEVLSGHVQNPAAVKKERSPSPPRRTRDQESVKMELVSDCSLSPEPGGLSQTGGGSIPAPIIAHQPIIAPPPAPPILPPVLAANRPMQSSFESSALPVWPGTADSSPSPPRKPAPSYLAPPPNFGHLPPYPGPPVYSAYNPPATSNYTPVSSMPYPSDMMMMSKPPPPPVMSFSTPPTPKPTTILPTVRITAKVTQPPPQLPTTPVAVKTTQPPPLQFMTPPVQINQPPPMLPSSAPPPMPPPMGMSVPPPCLPPMPNIPPPNMGMPPMGNNGYSMPPPMMNTSIAPPPLITSAPPPAPLIQEKPPIMLPNMSAPPPMVLPPIVAPMPIVPEVTVAPPLPRTAALPVRFDPTMARDIHWNDSPPTTPVYQAPVPISVQVPPPTQAPVIAPPISLMSEPIKPPAEARPAFTPQKKFEPKTPVMPNVTNTLMSALFGGIGQSASQDVPQQQQQQQSFNPIPGLGSSMGGPGGTRGPFGQSPGMETPGGFNRSPMMQQPQRMPQQGYGTPNRMRGGHQNQNQNSQQRKGGQGGRPYRPK